jgi:prepilin-type N-terminal cleavage/methylation domain-containing protein
MTIRATASAPASRSARRAAAGFSLVEIMVATAISGMILGAIVVAHTLSLRSFRAIENYQELHSQGRLAIDHFARDMRAAYDISSFTSTAITVKVPTTFDNRGNVVSDKTVSYTLSGGALYRNDSSTGNNSMLATNIHSLSFALYDRVGNPTALLSTAKGVQVNMNLRKTVVGVVQSEEFISARLEMRNKK